jgi:ParB family chromosome partitioning protein
MVLEEGNRSRVRRSGRRILTSSLYSVRSARPTESRPWSDIFHSDLTMQELQQLPLDLIEPNHSQPRRYFDEATLEELAGSIAERGVLQPVLVRPLEDGKYQMVAGERRWRAAQIAGLTTIPALVSAYDDLAALEVGLIENMARQDLNPLEEARACATLVSEFGLTYRQVGERVGRGSVTVWNLVRLLDLSTEILELIERGELSKSHGTALLAVEDSLVRSRLARAAIEHGWSTRTLDAQVRASNISPGDGSGSADSSVSPGASSTPLPSEEVAVNIARVWGDAVGAEVEVRTLSGRKLRVEFVFESPEGALAVGGRIGEAIARGSKRR